MHYITFKEYIFIFALSRQIGFSTNIFNIFNLYIGKDFMNENNAIHEIYTVKLFKFIITIFGLSSCDVSFVVCTTLSKAYNLPLMILSQ